jgi:fatty-acid desaturase
MIFRSTSKNSQRVILTQVILGTLSFFYFLFTAQYSFILYAGLMFFIFNHFFHNVALHRYFSHKAFKTNKFWHIFMAMFSPLASAGSPYAYAMAHRTHHMYSDQEKDPTNLDLVGRLKVAFFHWNLDNVPLSVMRNLGQDPWIMRSHNYYVLIILAFWGILALVDIRLALMYNLAALFMFFEYCIINIVNHTKLPFSYRNHDTKDNSQNDFITGFFFGDWHNNHHNKGYLWNQREKWWEWDIPAQIIKLIRTN